MPVKVQDLISRLESDGWFLVRQKRSHRQYHHPTKPGTVTVAGKPSLDMPPGTLSSILQAIRPEEVRSHMQYLVVIEHGSTSFGAYVPDLPGCVAVGQSREEVTTLIHEAIEFHVEGLKSDGQSVPQPSSTSELVEVDA